MHAFWRNLNRRHCKVRRRFPVIVTAVIITSKWRTFKRNPRLTSDFLTHHIRTVQNRSILLISTILQIPSKGDSRRFSRVLNFSPEISLRVANWNFCGRARISQFPTVSENSMMHVDNRGAKRFEFIFRHMSTIKLIKRHLDIVTIENRRNRSKKSRLIRPRVSKIYF